MRARVLIFVLTTSFLDRDKARSTYEEVTFTDRLEELPGMARLSFVKDEAIATACDCEGFVFVESGGQRCTLKPWRVSL